jgi:hypothetical protein
MCLDQGNNYRGGVGGHGNKGEGQGMGETMPVQATLEGGGVRSGSDSGINGEGQGDERR